MDKACIFNIQKFSLHDGPGIRTVVFFKGCPLKCFWCSNPESQNEKPEKMWNVQQEKKTIVGEYKSIDEIITEVMKDEPFYEESGGGVTLSGGEVLYQAEFATELLRQLKERGIHTACETTGVAKKDTFSDFIKQVDCLYFDVKHYDDQQHKNATGASLKNTLANLAYAVEKHANLVVRIPVIPHFNDGKKNAESFAQLFHKMGIKKVELLPFHQFGSKKYTFLNRKYTMEDIPPLHSEDLNYFKNVFNKHQIICNIQ